MVQIQYFQNYDQVQNNEFFQQMTPQLQNKLTNHLIKIHQKKFLYFFENPQTGFKLQANEVQMMLKNMKCQILLNNQSVLHYDEKISDIYLIKNGNVRVYNKSFDFILEYVEGSFFGEYQLMFDLLSGCEFIASVPHN